MAQLNTSPWPTTGSSPVQGITHVAWPPTVKSNSKGSGDIFSSQSEVNENRLTGVAPSQGNSNFADFGNVNTSSTDISAINNSAQFRDPFGGAPSSSFQQQSGKSRILHHMPYKSSTKQRINILLVKFLATP